MATRIITNIPKEKVDEIVMAHELAGAVSVRELREKDGEFTVIAIYEDVEHFNDFAARRPVAPA